MAYTISEPTNPFLPGENITWFTSSSTDRTETSFTYRYRLQITGVDDTFTTGTTGADVVGTFRIPPRPVTGVGNFSPMAVAKNYVVTPLPLDLNVTQSATGEGLAKLRIIYGQEYAQGGTGLTGMDSATGGTYFFWDAVIPDDAYPSYNWQDYIIQPGVTGTGLLTDGPLARCPLDYDLLWTIVGASAGFVRDKDSLIVPNTAQFFQTPANFTNYWQVILGQDSAGDGTWTTVGGNGIQPDNSIVGAGEFTEYVTTKPQKIGKVYQGDGIAIRLATATAWAGVSTMNEMWLVGYIAGDAEPNPIIQMDEVENTSDNTIYYQVGIGGTGYTASTDYEWIGFAWKNVGEASAPIIKSVVTWNLDSVSAYWNVLAAGATYPDIYPIAATADQTRLSYLNVGSQGVGLTGDFSVYIADAAGNALSETLTYSEDNCDACSNCDRKLLVWLNSLGGYDSYEFNCLVSGSIETTRQLTERTLPVGYVSGQRGRNNSANVGVVRRRVATQYTNKATTDWLESLMISPNVYEVQSDGSLLPVQVITNTFSTFVIQDKLKVTELEYELAYTRKSQIM